MAEIRNQGSRRHLHRHLGGLALAAALAGGCRPATSNRSPTAAEDPERFARAVQQAEAVARESREAEAQFYRRLRTAPPAALAGPQPILTSTDPATTNPEME